MVFFFFFSILFCISLKSLTRIASSVVQVNVTLTVPAEGLSLPLASDPNLSVAVNPPVAHWGPGPVNVRLISHTLRQGQVCVFFKKEIIN